MTCLAAGRLMMKTAIPAAGGYAGSAVGLASRRAPSTTGLCAAGVPATLVSASETRDVLSRCRLYCVLSTEEGSHSAMTKLSQPNPTSESQCAWQSRLRRQSPPSTARRLQHQRSDACAPRAI